MRPGRVHPGRRDRLEWTARRDFGLIGKKNIIRQRKRNQRSLLFGVGHIHDVWWYLAGCTNASTWLFAVVFGVPNNLIWSSARSGLNMDAKLQPLGSVGATSDVSQGATPPPMSTQNIRPKTSRCLLTSDKAAEIYSAKISILMSASPSNSLKGQSRMMALAFRISPKAIRDIWNRRTWQHATCHLWLSEQVHRDTAAENANLAFPLTQVSVSKFQ